MTAPPVTCRRFLARMCARAELRRPGLGGAAAVGERYLTQFEAARLTGVSKDTIIRARRAGRLPGARLVEGRWVVPASALAAAGLQSPGLAAADGVPNDESEDIDGAELAAAEVKIAALQDLLARQDDELRFLRQLLAETVTKQGRS